MFKRKRYGQHFLTHEETIKRIVEEAGLKGNEVVLEIGAGTGSLTKEILEHAKKVIAIEIDEKLVYELRSRFNKFIKSKKLEVIHCDALKIDFPKVDLIIGNIPFSISSRITEKVIRSGVPSVLTFQKEFAEKLLAKPGEKNASRISFLASYYATVEGLFIIPSRFFKPQPRVSSMVVRIKPNKKRVNDALLGVARLLYAHKNKSVRNSLLSSSGELGYEKKQLKELLGGLDLPNKKARQLETQEIVRVYEKLKNVILKKKKSLIQ